MLTRLDRVIYKTFKFGFETKDFTKHKCDLYIDDILNIKSMRQVEMIKYNLILCAGEVQYLNRLLYNVREMLCDMKIHGINSEWILEGNKRNFMEKMEEKLYVYLLKEFE